MGQGFFRHRSEASMKKALVKLAALWFSLILSCSPCFAQPENIRSVSPQDHFSHLRDDRFYTESWNYHIMLDTGELLSLAFVLSNLGIFSGYAGVQFTLSGTHCDPVIIKDELSLCHFKEDRSAGTISIGSQSIRTKGGLTYLTFSKDGIHADLTIHPWMAGVQVADGTTMINKEKGEFYRTFIEIPRGDLRGELTVRGAGRSVSGAVYMDHSVSNILPTAYSSDWYSLRAFFPDYTVALLEFQYLPKAGGGRWAIGYVTDRNKILAISTDYKVEKSGALRDKCCSMPNDFEVQMAVGDIRLNGSFQSDELCCRSAVLDNRNWLARSIARSVAGNPVVFRFLSHADLLLTISDQSRHLKGPAYVGIVSMGN
jgi:hypothetical protein